MYPSFSLLFLKELRSSGLDVAGMDDVDDVDDDSDGRLQFDAMDDFFLCLDVNVFVAVDNVDDVDDEDDLARMPVVTDKRIQTMIPVFDKPLMVCCFFIIISYMKTDIISKLNRLLL